MWLNPQETILVYILKSQFVANAQSFEYLSNTPPIDFLYLLLKISFVVQ